LEPKGLPQAIIGSADLRDENFETLLQKFQSYKNFRGVRIGAAFHREGFSFPFFFFSVFEVYLLQWNKPMVSIKVKRKETETIKLFLFLASPQIMSFADSPSLLEDPRVLKGASILAERNLILEVWCYSLQLSQLIALAKNSPSLSIVLNHIGTPVNIKFLFHFPIFPFLMNLSRTRETNFKNKKSTLNKEDPI